MHNSSLQKCRKEFLFPMKNANFSLKQTRELNFNATSYLWTKCLNTLANNVGGRLPLKGELIKEINQHCKKNSSIAANKYLKKIKSNAYYRNTTFKSLYNRFNLREKLSHSTFYKYSRKEFKKPKRLSDMCVHCEEYKVIKSFILKKNSSVQIN